MSFFKALFFLGIISCLIFGVRHYNHKKVQKAEDIENDTKESAVAQTATQSPQNPSPKDVATGLNDKVNASSSVDFKSNSSVAPQTEALKPNTAEQALANADSMGGANPIAQSAIPTKVLPSEVKFPGLTPEGRLGISAYQQYKQAILESLNLSDEQLAAVAQVEAAKSQALKEIMQSQLNAQGSAPAPNMQAVMQMTTQYNAQLAQIMGPQQYAQYQQQMAQQAQKAMAAYKGGSGAPSANGPPRSPSSGP